MVDTNLDSIEDWTFDDQDTTDEFGHEAEKEMRKMIEWNEELKDAESIESLENWTLRDDDTKEDSGCENELEMKKNRKYLQKRPKEIKSSILHR